jgi:hypothetical protein
MVFLSEQKKEQLRMAPDSAARCQCHDALRVTDTAQKADRLPDQHLHNLTRTTAEWMNCSPRHDVWCRSGRPRLRLHCVQWCRKSASAIYNGAIAKKKLAPEAWPSSNCATSPDASGSSKR